MTTTAQTDAAPRIARLIATEIGARPEQVTVRGLDRNGKKIRRKAGGLLARALQHEIDHLQGILFTDKLVEGAELRFAPPEPSATGSPTPA